MQKVKEPASLSSSTHSAASLGSSLGFGLAGACFLLGGSARRRLPIVSVLWVTLMVALFALFTAGGLGDAGSSVITW
jgi:hypothetical protein